jgi:hypothetical protein
LTAATDRVDTTEIGDLDQPQVGVLRVADEVPAEADHLVEAKGLEEGEPGREVHPRVFQRDPRDRHCK